MSPSGSADNSVLLSENTPPVSVVSNRSSVVAQWSPLSDLLDINVPVEITQRRGYYRKVYIFTSAARKKSKGKVTIE